MQKQWLITLQGLTAAGRNWDTSISADVLGDEHRGHVDAIPGLVNDVTWTASLQRMGNVYHLSGQWNTAIKRECSRCTAPFDWQAAGVMERDFQLGDAHGLNARDAEAASGICECLPAPGELDLLDVLREDIWLGWKADVVCNDACKGLCLGCGCNLNTEVCSCTKDESSHPFAALRKLKLEG